jgi:cytochrome P450
MDTSTGPVVPNHVPPHLVYDFHLFGDPRYIADPYSRTLEVLKEAPPIFWSPRGHCWYATKYSTIVDITKQFETFSNELIPGMPADYPYQPAPQGMDPPNHTLFAAPLKAAFSPQSMAKLETQIRALASECIEPLVSQGRCEFMTTVAEPLPILIFLAIMGLPRERFAEFRRIAVWYLGSPTDEVMAGRVIKVDEMLMEFIEERRKRPQDDLISKLWNCEFDGRPITLNEMRRYALMLFSAGLDSVTNGLGHSMRHLARHPDLQTRLRENPKQIYAATEELLRRYGVTTPPRRLTRDIEFEGVTMRQNDIIKLWVIAGNLDPTAFSEPTKVVPNREGRTHLTFGFGIHRCIGAHLARIELHVLYEEWLKRIPLMQVDPDRQMTFDPGHVLRITQLPLKWAS